jgi:hypothetical protein
VRLLNQDETKDEIIWKYNNTKEIDQIMVDEVYFLIMLSLKFTFDIFSFLKSISSKIE